MPRRRKRTTDRVRQEDRRLRVRGERREVPDTKKLSRAYIGLALARAQAEAAAQADVSAEGAPDTSKAHATPPEPRHDRS